MKHPGYKRNELVEAFNARPSFTWIGEDARQCLVLVRFGSIAIHIQCTPNGYTMRTKSEPYITWAGEKAAVGLDHLDSELSRARVARA